MIDLLQPATILLDETVFSATASLRYLYVSLGFTLLTLTTLALLAAAFKNKN